MTIFLCHLAFLGVVVPVFFFLARLAAPLARKEKTLLLPFLLAAGAVLFLFRPHEDILAGLDCMAYRKMAETFLEGREIVGRDNVAGLPPEDLRSAFYYKPISRLRPTRDVVFQIAPGEDLTRPFFEPLLPLAAAGSHIPAHFISLLGFLWLATLLSACQLTGGRRGLLVAAALFLATPWPAWHLRGYHAEGAAAILAAIVYLSSAAKPFERPATYAIAAFSLGLSIAIHPTALLVSAPVLLSLLPGAKTASRRLALVVGGLLGLLPLVLITRHICQPYGDWTRPETLRLIFRAAAEHKSIILSAIGLAMAVGVSLVLSSCPSGRRLAKGLDRKLGPLGWSILALLPLLLMAIIPIPATAAIRTGALSCWTGIRFPCAIIWMAAFLAIVFAPSSKDDGVRERTAPARILLVLLFWTALAFFLLKGVERNAGLWSLRRFLPSALLLTSLFAFALAGTRRLPFPRLAKGAISLAFIGCALYNPLTNPAAYLLINEKGTRQWRADLAGTIREADLVVFDYHPHSVPFASDPDLRVLGLGKHAHGRWPAVERWLGDVAKTGEVVVATSWSPSNVLETDGSLRPYRTGREAGNRFDVSYPVLSAKGFLPVERRVKTASVSLFSFLPNSRLGHLTQDKFLDGSPIGLRGPWGKTKDGATWTRQGSAIVGPVTNRGTIVVTLDASWPDHPSVQGQPMTLTPPWGGEGAVSFQVATQKKGEQPSPIVLELPAPTNATGRTGLYRFSSPTPYDPAADGIRGYDSDLGIVLRRIRIETRDE